PQYLFPGGTPQAFDITQTVRFIQDVRLRETFLGGGNAPSDLGINDIETAVTFTVPNFLTTGQPLFISPALALHLWDGPTGLPAGGLLWTPTPQVRFDIFFPQPKLSAYLTTVGQYELWWYLAGEYGGGAWTIQRADGTDDRVDINDIRASAGLEMTGPRGISA